MAIAGRIQMGLSKSVLVGWAFIFGYGLFVAGWVAWFLWTGGVDIALNFGFDAVRSRGLGPVPILRADGTVEAVLVHGRSARYEGGTQTLELWLDGGPRGTTLQHFPERVLSSEGEFTDVAVVAMSEYDRQDGSIGLEAWVVGNSRRSGAALARLRLEPEAQPQIVTPLWRAPRWNLVHQVVALDLGSGSAEISLDVDFQPNEREWLRFPLLVEGGGWTAGPARTEPNPVSSPLELVTIAPRLPREFWQFSFGPGALAASRLVPGEAAQHGPWTVPVAVGSAGVTIRPLLSDDPLLAKFVRRGPPAVDGSPPSPPPHERTPSAFAIQTSAADEPPLVLFADTRSAQALTPGYVVDEPQLVGPDGRKHTLLPILFLDPTAASSPIWRRIGHSRPNESEPGPWYAWRDILLPR